MYQSDFHLSLYQCTICSFNQINKKNEIQILLYPNPTTGELNITSYELRIKGVEIYDIYGRKVGEKFPSNILEGWQPQADGVVINLTVFPTSIYFAKITTEQGDVLKKVVKQ